MKTLDRIYKVLTRILTITGGFFLLGMIALTCANIFLRFVWIPIRGTFELMGYFGAVVTAFSLAYTQLNKSHIAVDVLVNTFSSNTKAVLQSINEAVCCAFFIVAAWQLNKKATILLNTGEVTETLRIIYYPFTYAVAFGCLMLSLVLIADLIRRFIPKEGDSV